jgi:hypothetical protein
MSTKTTIKRIALVAVAALGFGMLSAIPSSAAVAAGPTITVTNGSAELTQGTAEETSTAGLIQVNALLTAAADSVAVSVTRSSYASGGSAVKFNLGLWDTSTAATKVEQVAAGAVLSGTSLVAFAKGAANSITVPDSTTAFTTSSGASYILASGANSINNGYVDATMFLQVESSTAFTRVKGDYVFTVVVQAFNNGALASTTTKDITITVNDLATNSLTVKAASSTAYIGTSTGATSDAVITAVATASTTDHATISVRTYNAAGGAAPESITATLTGPNLLQFNLR